MTPDPLIEKVKNLLKELSKLEYGASTPMSKEECWKLAEEIIFKALLKHGEEVRAEEAKRYQPFLNWLFEEVFEGSPEACDIQDKAEELELLILCKVPPKEIKNYEACEETDEIYLPFWLEEAKKWAIRNKKGGKG